MLLMPGSAPASAANGSPSPISLYGDSVRGWGLNNTTITSPGPTLTVPLGYPVTLALAGLEQGGVTHNWFIDYNGNDQPDVGEPKSPDFTKAGPILFTFIPDRNGSFTYKCAYHPRSMVGTIRVIPQTNVTLYGNFARGWGLSNSTIQKPGPSLVLLSGTNVTFILIANDTSVTHDFFIDYDGSRTPGPGEPKAPDFSGGNPVKVTIHLDRAGNFTYYCEYHPGDMYGTVVILGPAVAGGGFNVALIPGIMLLALGGVLIFAAIYHVRAVRAVKRAK